MSTDSILIKNRTANEQVLRDEMRAAEDTLDKLQTLEGDKNRELTNISKQFQNVKSEASRILELSDKDWEDEWCALWDKWAEINSGIVCLEKEISKTHLI